MTRPLVASRGTTELEHLRPLKVHTPAVQQFGVSKTDHFEVGLRAGRKPPAGRVAAHTRQIERQLGYELEREADTYCGVSTKAICTCFLAAAGLEEGSPSVESFGGSTATLVPPKVTPGRC
jgi:hypothetical protein